MKTTPFLSLSSLIARSYDSALSHPDMGFVSIIAKLFKPIGG